MNCNTPPRTSEVLVLAIQDAAFPTDPGRSNRSIHGSNNASPGFAWKACRHSPDPALSLIAAAPVAASVANWLPNQIAGTTTIKPIQKTEIKAATLGALSLPSTQRCEGAKIIARAKAQVSAGTKGMVNR
jgi:hypothetical protein